ncbi:MAG: LexA family protein [Candidatus Sulfotelmatobacter sp.]
MAITRRQREVYDFISRFVAEHGYSPSFDEIGTGLNLSSLATVHKHIQSRKKGTAHPRLQPQPLHRPAAAQGTPQAGHEREHRAGAAAAGAHRRWPAD